MPVFNDSEQAGILVPEGDYIFCCTEFEIGLATSGVTSGSEKYELKLELEGKGATVKERLTDHPKTAWVIDLFLKSAGVKLVKGEAYSFREDEALASDLRWINPIGLRGHCRVFVDTFLKKGDEAGKPTGKSNKIQLYYTDRPKLPPRITEVAEEDRPFDS